MRALLLSSRWTDQIPAPVQVILDFENQMKEAVNEEHEGKRKCELTWKVHRIHWEKNRFIYDLMYVRKVMSRELVRSVLAKSPPSTPPVCVLRSCQSCPASPAVPCPIFLCAYCPSLHAV